MQRDFKWLHEKYGDESRNILEKICLSIFELEYPNDEVQDVRTTQGDGGIDVFINHESEELTIIQCKFYLGDLTNSRKQNINKSYERALTTKKDSITKWILCTPKVFSIKEHEWWEVWKKKKENDFFEKYNQQTKISLLSGNKLMALIKKHGLYEEYFENERVDKKLVDKLLEGNEKKIVNEKMHVLIGLIKRGDYFDIALVSSIDEIMYLSEHRIFKKNDLFHYLDLLNKHISYHSGKKDEEFSKKEFMLRKKIIEEYEKLDI